MSTNPREIAIKVLKDINENNAYSNIELNKYLDKNLDIRDEKLIREIVYGVLENMIYIDYIISKASKIRVKKIHKIILEIVRIGIYQIVFMDKIPSSAAVNESVKLAKKYGHRATIGYVNGLLREIVRNTEKYTTIDTVDKIEEISIRYSHPKFLVKRWAKEFGIEFTEELCKSNNEKPGLNIRVNTLKISKDNLINRLENKGLKVVEGIYAEDCLIVLNPNRITESDEYMEGLFTIQDESSMLVSQIMNPIGGSKVIDLCSAPGGKATHIAQYMKNKGLILSRDYHQHKLKLINDNSTRLGVEIIETEANDALIRDDKLVGKFDFVLLDAPCSGFGIIRRKPEIKFNKSEEDIIALSRLQEQMLRNAKDYLKPGGILVYSTCTITKEENIMIVNNFLEKNSNFKLMNIEDRFNIREKLDTLDYGYIQLFPNIHGTDGFFIAKMIRER